MTRRSLLPAGLGVVAAMALAMAAAPTVADACGGFFSRKQLEEGRRPSLAWEQALIVFDQEKQREHFIREVVFRRSSEPFGFVVPTPSRPEVARVARSPFAALRTKFPYDGDRGGRLGGVGTVGRGPGGGVEVLEKKRVGSFTAFVLAADDASALTGWLGENGFETSREAVPWLQHYVARRFFYVAMRYEPPPSAAASSAASAETVRISFDTPLPYYPYFEPERPGPLDTEDPRLLDLWLVTGEHHAPVAARTRDGVTTWERPMAEGKRFDVGVRQAMQEVMGAEKGLIGEGALTVQRFTDQKRSRSGWGDVVFIPRERRPADAARRAALRRLTSTLDPSLAPAAP
jgi:hypothetical protein